MSKLLCGTARSQITPPKELIKNLFGLMHTSFGEIHDELFVRVIALSNRTNKALIVSFDLDKAPRPDEFVPKLAEETGVAEEFIFYFGIHTHTAPITSYRPFEPNNDITKKSPEVQAAVASYEAFVWSRLVEASKSALASLRPARLGCGWGESHINVNRSQSYTVTNKGEPVQTILTNGVRTDAVPSMRLFVCKLEDNDGLPIAFFVNYPVHGVAMFLNNQGDGRSQIGGDIGGNVSQQMEIAYPGSVAVWSSGAAGDINPMMMTQLFYPDPVTGAPVERRIQSLDASEAILNMLVGRHIVDINNILSKIVVSDTEGVLCASVDWVNTPTCKDSLHNANRKPEEDETYDIRMHTLRIGDIALVGINGELYSSIGNDICKASPLTNTVIVNHEASLLLNNPGYIMDGETIRRSQQADLVQLPGAAAFRGVPDAISEMLSAQIRITLGADLPKE